MKSTVAGLRYLPPQKGFLGLPPEQAMSPEAAKALVIPFGLEKSVSYSGGTASGPRAILEASPNLEYFDEEFWAEPFRDYGIATLEEPETGNSLPDALGRLEEIVETALANDKFPLILGGEHSLTAGAIRPFARRHEKLTILHFDAHADLRDGYEGEKFSHAAAMRRCLDHENVELVSIGIRNISAEEVPFLEANRHRIKIFWAKDMPSWNLAEIGSLLAGKPVYISFDLDGFDSSLMPATGTPEPGGLFWHTVMDILSLAGKASDIAGADVVELAPSPGLHACDFLAAKLCYKILSHALAAKTNRG